MVALESGRNVDVDELLQRELSPVPLSIATPKGSLREAPGKSDLSFEQDITTECFSEPAPCQPE